MQIEAGMISLSEQRKQLNVSKKYIIRSFALTNLVTKEICIASNRDCTRRAQNTPSIQPVRNYINHLINKCNIDITYIPVLSPPQMAQ